MQEGFVSFMKRYYYWVFITMSVSGVFLGVFFPEMAVLVLFVVLALVGFFAYYYYKYDILKMEKNPTRGSGPKLMKMEDVDAHAPLSQMPDLDRMADEAARGPAQVKAHVIEGSGMELVERYIPLGEMLFPIAFIARREEGRYQEGSLEVGKPLCLWHGEPVWFAHSEKPNGTKYQYYCQKCPKGGRAIGKSLVDTTKVIELIATSTLRSGKMVMIDETLPEASKRGRGELPG